MDLRQILEHFAKGVQFSDTESLDKLNSFISSFEESVNKVNDEVYKLHLITEAKKRFSGYVSEYVEPVRLFNYLNILKTFLENVADGKVDRMVSISKSYDLFEYAESKTFK